MWEDYYPNELSHHGVKGQRWGVRRNVDKTSSRRGSTNKANVSQNDKKVKRKANNRRKISVGRRFVDIMKSTKTRQIIGSTAAIASGALWVASAVMPGPVSIAANTAAAAANMVSVGLNK